MKRLIGFLQFNGDSICRRKLRFISHHKVDILSINLLVACFLLLSVHTEGQSPLVVQTTTPTATIQPTMWGVFFEDINLGADGGLYAELVKNRSFEFANPMMGWKELKSTVAKDNTLIINRGEQNKSNPRFARVTVSTEASNYGLANEGFRGMGVKKDNGYDFSIWASVQEGSTATIMVELSDSTGKIIGSTSLSINGKDWKKYTASFTASATVPKAHLNIWFKGKGVYDIDMVSLFPKDTWKNRPGGLRADLVQLLADMKPGFIRFPGGCIVEGRDLANRYQWKKTVGNVEDRQLIINRWNTEFADRSTPDYFQSFGLGFFEYFQLAEDIGASPLPILNCGMACQFNSSEVVPAEQLDPYIQDALDLIEFTNADAATTKWGALRASMGHPQPFNLKMMGVGNEQWGPQYIERNIAFTKAIKAKYPNIQLVNSVGPFPEGEWFKFLNDTLRTVKADLLDEHYYRSPDWFLKNANRYDQYDRKGSKIFAGEYAAHTQLTKIAEKKNNWQSALAEAAFMTGLERNADVVYMASYAPLFAHIEGWQWAPDLIWMDNLQAYGSPSYYVQKLFSTNKGTRVLPISINNHLIEGQDSLYATAALDESNNEIILKIVNTGSQSQTKQIILQGSKPKTQAALIVLRSDQLESVNSFVTPKAIVPVFSTINTLANEIKIELAPYSLNIIRVKK